MFSCSLSGQRRQLSTAEVSADGDAEPIEYQEGDYEMMEASAKTRVLSRSSKTTEVAELDEVAGSGEKRVLLETVDVKKMLSEATEAMLSSSLCVPSFFQMCYNVPLLAVRKKTVTETKNTTYTIRRVLKARNSFVDEVVPAGSHAIRRLSEETGRQLQQDSVETTTSTTFELEAQELKPPPPTFNAIGRDGR